jgi:hypothetical protein
VHDISSTGRNLTDHARARPFYATLGFIAVALSGYVAYRFTLAAVNKRRQQKLENMTPEEIEEERTTSLRYADRKYTFAYGL